MGTTWRAAPAALAAALALVVIATLAGCDVGTSRPAEGTRSAGAVVPGIEDVDVDDRGDLWAVSESGARPYQRLGRPMVPMLTRFDTRALLSGPRPTCDL